MEFDWDEGNRDKNLRLHDVHDWEIEEAMLDPRRMEADAYSPPNERRRAALGRSSTSGKYLRIVYTVRVRSGRRLIRPISAMPMAAADRARYSK